MGLHRLHVEHRRDGRLRGRDLEDPHAEGHAGGPGDLEQGAGYQAGQGGDRQDTAAARHAVLRGHLAQSPEPGERLLLIFHGLDTFATIWLNGEELGGHQNMFREAVFDVGGRVRPGEPNALAVCFDRPLDHTDEPVPGQRGRNASPCARPSSASAGTGIPGCPP
jgi:hypothetical protein